MLRNRDDDKKYFSLAERDAKESSFFASSRYRELLRDRTGITHLRARLSTLLFEHLKKELPSLKKDRLWLKI